jgi:hypothetical protein
MFRDPEILPFLLASIQRLEKLNLDSEVSKDGDLATGEQGKLQTPVPSSEEAIKQPLSKEDLHTPVNVFDPYDSVYHARHSHINLSNFYGFQPKIKAINQHEIPPFPSSSLTQGVPFIYDAITVESSHKMHGQRELSKSGLSTNYRQVNFSPSNMEEEPQVFQKHLAGDSQGPFKHSASKEKTASEGGDSASDTPEDTTTTFIKICKLLQLYCEETIPMQQNACAAFVTSANVYPLRARQALNLAEICFLFTSFTSQILSATETLMNRIAMYNSPTIELNNFYESFTKMSATMPQLQVEFQELMSAYVCLMRSEHDSDRKRYKQRGRELQLDIICQQLDIASELLTKTFQKLLESLRP